MKTPYHMPALLLAVLLLADCTTAACALHDRLAAASPSERFAILRQQCRQVAGNDPRAARMVTACDEMERFLSAPSSAMGSAAADAFNRSYEACVDESKRDGRLFSSHMKIVQAYYDSRAVCDAYQALFATRNASAP
jgi:hypothetical protein